MNLIPHNHQGREFRSILMTNGPQVMLWQLCYGNNFQVGNYTMAVMSWHLLYYSSQAHCIDKDKHIRQKLRVYEVAAFTLRNLKEELEA